MVRCPAGGAPGDVEVVHPVWPFYAGRDGGCDAPAGVTAMTGRIGAAPGHFDRLAGCLHLTTS
ncbi:hypothetical protein ARTHRO9AX_80395 [Arthrobacter sp. 9AX]|nr:hypothetical protein ARTHRO9AX_80395 [Arthrobacter sp. 9AX]